MPTKEKKYGFVTIIIFNNKNNVSNNSTSIHPSQRYGDWIRDPDDKVSVSRFFI